MKMSALTTEGEMLMKTKMKVLLMSLCAAFIMLAGSGATVHAEGLSFSYAYDVQRNEHLKTNNTIICSDLKQPYKGLGQQVDSNGTWTLTEKGPYEDQDEEIKGNTDKIAGYVASLYNDLEKDAVCIHELEVNGTHIAYGVIMAMTSERDDKYVVFVGDSLPQGAGYLLSTREVSGSGPVTVYGNKTARDYAKKVLSLTGEDSDDIFGVGEDYSYGEFKPVEEGYGDLSAQLTVKNNSNAEINDLTVAVEGTNAEYFELSKKSITSIAAGNVDTFTVTPKTGLQQNIYEATVVVKNSTGSILASFNIYFTVTAPQVPPTPVAPSEPTPIPSEPTATPAPVNNDSNDNDTVQETATATPTPTPAPEVLYTVKKGDTLSKIARINGCSLRELMEANAELLQYRSLIYPNWILKIPQNNALSMAAQDAQGSGTTKLYKVQKGDSLWKIAHNNHCTVKEIIDLNPITVQKADLIYPGWDLTLPEK